MVKWPAISNLEKYHRVSHGTLGLPIVETNNVSRETQKSPFEVYDAISGRYVRLRLALLSLAADNPMSSEISGHIGSRGNYFCRKCLAGGSKEEKRSDIVFHSLFEAGEPRSNETVKSAIVYQIAAFATKGSQRMNREQTASGIKWSIPHSVLDSFKEEAARFQIRSIEEMLPRVHDSLLQRPDLAEITFPASALCEGFDGSRDSPVEILHTILLGIVKYIWGETHKHLIKTTSQAQRKAFLERLHCANLKGMNIPKLQPSYLLQHGGGLQGPEFRSLVQIGAFQLRDCVDEDLWKLWKAAGVLAALIWMPVIVNHELYLVSRNIEMNIPESVLTFSYRKCCEPQVPTYSICSPPDILK